jgi:hypothetical protein
MTDKPIHPETEMIASAIQFINSTASHIFLTGKAGTGKTTFLKNLAKRTHKSFVIVAPTGIAALNAGGVTIHSQFLFPFGMFLPERNLGYDLNNPGNFFTSDTLARKHPLNSTRKQVLRSIDLLVIDEVSMLRADLLDAIDYRLRAARGNFRQPFGGVQLLLIGDLFQLPPVVKEADEEQLKKYYHTPWFFDAHSLQESKFVYIELDKIFRQSDGDFIDLLNNLRNNQTTVDDIELLNRYYKSPNEILNMREVITLTTHNYKADDLNRKALQELKTTLHKLAATVEGDFPESMYPVLAEIELKEGAQIMFTKNDNEGKAYFNGKLATVSSISKDEIVVLMADTYQEYSLKKGVWENKRYTVNATSQELDDEVIGTFEQYPIKLAWAITVHKSQGLTFDKAIIDVGQAFADGQVYVALSRLRSLDGLILRTQIDANVISTNHQVVAFSQEHNQPTELGSKMQSKQLDFIEELIDKTFDFDSLVKEIAHIQKGDDHTGFEEESMKPVLDQIKETLNGEAQNTQKFRRQLADLMRSNQRTPLIERLKKGSDYYKNLLYATTKSLLEHIEVVRQQKRVKGYLTSLTDLDQLIAKKLEEVDKSLYLTQTILEGSQQFDFTVLAKEREKERYKLLEEVRSKVGVQVRKERTETRGRKSKRSKKDEPSTYDVTLQMLERGMTIADIAKERGLVAGTIEGHLAKAVSANRISIFKFMTEEDVNSISQALNEMPEGFSSKDLFAKLGGKFGYGVLRAVMNHTGIQSTRQRDDGV